MLTALPHAMRADASETVGATVTRVQSGEIESYDGTTIRFVVYVPGGVTPSTPAPAILAGHNGGGPEDADPPDPSALSATLRGLLRAGFIVQTWAARGYSPSAGVAQLNSPDFEVKDVKALVDALADRPDVVKDGPRDPRVGMVGESYGAWIQLLSAQADPRIDAISPRWTLYDPVQDFEPNGVLRSGWTATVEAVLAARANFDPKVHEVFRDALRDGKLTESGRAFLAYRSAKTSIAQVRVPTLLIQSVSDTLTTANNAVAIYKELGDGAVPVKLYLFCGGHTQALLVDNSTGFSCDPTQTPARIPELVVTWMDNHLRGDGGRLGPPIQWELQDGSLHTASHLPSAAAQTALQAELTGAVLVRTGDPYQGGAVVATPSPDGVRVLVPDAGGKTVLGVPRVTMSVTGQGTEAYVFSKLVDLDTSTGKLLVIDEQATPMSFSVLSSSPQTKAFDMAAIAWKVESGHQLFYEVSPTSTDFAASRHASIAEVRATVRIPVVEGDVPA